MKNISCENTPINNGNGEYEVKGKLKSASNKKIIFYAANPPTYGGSFSGSGLPYANEEMAFENTPNVGSVLTDNNGNFKFKIKYPNSYYNVTKLIEPVVYVRVCGKKEIHTIPLKNGIPFRLLTYPPQRQEPEFYNTIGRNFLPVRNQEQILRDSGYPSKNIMPKNFWGNAVPHS